jgi:spermidine/putrescine transport system substrate-binding protein
MTEPIDPIRMRRAMHARLTRRTFMKGTGAGIAGISLASILAACGGDNGPGAAPPTDVFKGEPGNLVHFANWPLYMDEGEDANGKVTYPSLDAFTKKTGIDVDYKDLINENAEFFGKLQPQFEAGDPTGWDIIVITNGRHLTALTQSGWVYELDPALRPNFEANAADFARDPVYDAANKHTMAWQSGITGIGVNLDKVNGSIESLDDLANPDKVGTDSVGMLREDMPNAAMIHLGIDPEASGPDEWNEAKAWLQHQKDAGTVRKYYTQGYIDDFKVGNLAASMAWSGDIEYYRVWEDKPYQFVFPETGALLWIDNMMIPVGAANPVGAIQLMDWYYQPEIADMLTEYVLYMTPVKGVQDLMLENAKKYRDDGDEDTAKRTEESAHNQYLFPSDEFLAKTRWGRNLTTDDEVEEWDAIFDPISQS